MVSKEVDEFSSLFDLTPNIAILDLNNGCETVTKALNGFTASIDADITTLEPAPLIDLRPKIKRTNYDYGVISDSILDHVDKKNLMKMITLAIRDSGYIIVLEKKEKSLDEIYALLEEFDFGAVSSIDIFEDHNLLMGKKMHMWGMD